MANSGREPEYYADDEISLTELASSVWRIRGIIAGAALVACALASAFLAYSQLTEIRRDAVTGFIELTAITNSQYPSGAAFSPTDLTSPEVLESVRETLKLEDTIELGDALTVAYGHPKSGALRAERDAAIKNATANEIGVAEIQELQTTYDTRIRSLNQNGLKLSVNIDQLSISPATGITIIETLPKTWQTVYADRYRILVSDEIARLSRIDLSESISTGDAPLATDQYLRQARATLAAINNDPRLSMLTSPNGATASEFIYQLDQFRQLYFDPYLASKIQNGNTLGQLFIQDLLANRTELKAKLAETSQTIDTIASMRNQMRALNQDAQQARNPNDQAMLNLNGDGLNSIINLAQQSGMQDYLTQLFERRFGLIEQIAEINTRIEKFTNNSIEGFDSDTYAEAVNAQFNQFEAAVAALVDLAHSRARQTTSNLYEFIATPALPSELPEPSRASMILILSALLGSAVGLVGGLLMRVIRGANASG